MSRYKFAEIHCDSFMLRRRVAYEHKDYFQPGHQSLARAIRDARNEGWTREKINGKHYDFCPSCSETRI